MGCFEQATIWKRFGIDWDDTWWGPAQYFDGYKLDTDWGIAWEHRPVFEGGFKVDKYAQFFFHENGINGSLVGADPESVIGSSEQNTLVARAVPTWQFGEGHELAIGGSVLVGQIKNAPILHLATRPGSYVSPGDQVEFAWGVDATYTQGRFKTYAEFMQSYGIRSPERYVSGGPSNRLTAVLAGARYEWEKLAFRFNYSAGFDANPSGTQHMFMPSATLALTPNVDLWVEYVRSYVRGHASAGDFDLENGIQFLIHWHI